MGTQCASHESPLDPPTHFSWITCSIQIEHHTRLIGGECALIVHFQVFCVEMTMSGWILTSGSTAPILQNWAWWVERRDDCPVTTTKTKRQCYRTIVSFLSTTHEFTLVWIKIQTNKTWFYDIHIRYRWQELTLRVQLRWLTAICSEWMSYKITFLFHFL